MGPFSFPPTRITHARMEGIGMRVRSHLSLLAVAVLLLAPSVSSAQQSTFADFEAYREAMVGRWLGEVTWITDWPGLGIKGEKTIAHVENRSEADGRIMISSFYGGNGTSRSIVVFDAATGEIRETGSDSGGTTWVCVISRQAGQWGSRCTGSLSDGTPTEGENTLAISDSGDTHRRTGRNTVGGVETDPLQDIWRRISR